MPISMACHGQLQEEVELKLHQYTSLLVKGTTQFTRGMLKRVLQQGYRLQNMRLELSGSVVYHTSSSRLHVRTCVTTVKVFVYNLEVLYKKRKNPTYAGVPETCC